MWWTTNCANAPAVNVKADGLAPGAAKTALPLTQGYYSTMTGKMQEEFLRSKDEGLCGPQMMVLTWLLRFVKDGSIVILRSSDGGK